MIEWIEYCMNPPWKTMTVASPLSFPSSLPTRPVALPFLIVTLSWAIALVRHFSSPWLERAELPLLLNSSTTYTPSHNRNSFILCQPHLGLEPQPCRLAGFQPSTAPPRRASSDSQLPPKLMKLEVVLEWFLRVGWIAGVLPIVFAFFPALHHLRHFLSIFANRGKTVSSSTKRFLIPQSYFLHFYVVAVLWTTFLLSCIWCHALGREASFAYVGYHTKFAIVELKHRVWRAVFTLLLMEIHVLRRLYESIFVFKYSSSAKMHAIGYLTGLCFYIAAPLSIFCSARLESSQYIKSLSEVVGRCPTGLSWPNYVKPLIELSWFQWIGALIFIWGSVHQFYCHFILGSVRRQSGAGVYVIVNGDWFELVSCPHYLAEIIIYAGLVVSCGGLDLTMWLLFAFVVMNLVFAAVETQEWYLRKFDNYPSSRRAIFPWFF